MKRLFASFFVHYSDGTGGVAKMTPSSERKSFLFWCRRLRGGTELRSLPPAKESGSPGSGACVAKCGTSAAARVRVRRRWDGWLHSRWWLFPGQVRREVGFGLYVKVTFEYQ